LKSLFNNIESFGLLWELVKQDFSQRYIENVFGVAWAFVQPIITILILWFVFEIGFKSQPVNNVPFILWLVAGILPWFFVTDALVSGTSSIVDKSFLVNKVVFSVRLLPVIKIITALFIHLCFIFFMFVLFTLSGVEPTIYWIQIFYYAFAAICLIFSILLFTSAALVFVRDVNQFISMFIQFGFWLTPIFWSLSIIPEKYHELVMLNPFAYITEGYRNSLINDVWFWETPQLTIYFWIVTTVLFVLGTMFFRKLRPYFSDVI
jgi:lipopolysaccharide transport system permease protein/teichoic acid transport system permease protein